MNITVYLGASKGNDNTLANAVRELGTWIGESGNSLVYGGSKSGLMGEIAESVLRAGGKVTGVEPQFFIDAVLYEDVTNLIVTNDMSERKAKMIELWMLLSHFWWYWYIGRNHGNYVRKCRWDVWMLRVFFIILTVIMTV